MYEVRQILFNGVLKEIILRTDDIKEIIRFMNDTINNSLNKITEENFFEFYEIFDSKKGINNYQLLNELKEIKEE